MKLSELRAQIKENIKEILSEDAYELEGTTGKTVTSFKTSTDANKFKSQNPNIKNIKKLEEEKYTDEDIFYDFFYKEFKEDEGMAMSLSTKLLNYLKGRGYSLNKDTIKEEELDEMARTAANLTVANKEAAEEIKSKFKGKWLEQMIDIILDAGTEGISQPEVAKMLGKVQPAINPQVRALTAAGVLKLTGAAPSEPKVKEPKEKMFKPKDASIDKDEAPEEKIDTWYDDDKEDKGFDEKEPTKGDIDKSIGTKLSSTKDKYNSLIKQMKDIAGKYKTAAGDEAKTYMDQLKDLTKEKKKLEAILNPSIGDDDL